MPLALLGLGANLGDRAATLNTAIEAFEQLRATRVVRRSAFRETSPVGGPADQPAYLNAAVIVDTQLPPEALLGELHAIEASLGRRRDMHWGPRTIDLDLLLYEKQVIETETLTLPHPRMTFRRFVLEPSVEIAGDWTHPTSNISLAELLATLQTDSPYIAIDADVSHVGEPEASTPRVAAPRLAHDVARLSKARLITLPHPPDDVRMAISAGRALQVAVEFLATLRSLLDSSSWTEPQRPAIADFWIERVGLQIASWLSSDALSSEERTAFEREWRQAQNEMRSPTLLVLLPKTPWPNFRGPTLRLMSDDHDDQCREVTAAMQAMR